MATHRMHVLGFRRKRSGRTNYRQRMKLLTSGKQRIVVRKSNNHILIQMIQYQPQGDRITATAHSAELKKIGWKLHTGNLPAAYLTGLLFGLRAKKHKEGVLDIGLYSSKKGARIYAALKGCVDAGLSIPDGELVLPSQDRLKGEHIKGFLSTCKTPHQFSSYRKSQLKPEDIPLHVEELKNKILKMNHEKKD